MLSAVIRRKKFSRGCLSIGKISRSLSLTFILILFLSSSIIEALLVENVDYTQSNDGTNNILEINYNHSTHNFKIVGTHAIPEFSWLMLLPLFLFVLSLGSAD